MERGFGPMVQTALDEIAAGPEESGRGGGAEAATEAVESRVHACPASIRLTPACLCHPA